MSMLERLLTQHVGVGLWGRGGDLSLRFGELQKISDDLLFVFHLSPWVGERLKRAG